MGSFIFALMLAISTHEVGHGTVAYLQGAKTIEFHALPPRTEVTWNKPFDMDNFLLGGVAGTQAAYYATKNSSNSFLRTYAKICRFDLYFQTAKGVFNVPGADLSQDRWRYAIIPIAIDLHSTSRKANFFISPGTNSFLVGIKIRW